MTPLASSTLSGYCISHFKNIERFIKVSDLIQNLHCFLSDIHWKDDTSTMKIILSYPYSAFNGQA